MKTLALATALTLTMCSPAYAQEADGVTVTGLQTVDQVLAYLGSLTAFLTLLATVLPRALRLTQLAARFSMDIRGILTPDPKDDPKWAGGGK